MPSNTQWLDPGNSTAIVAGTDEVGRGPLAGDVVAAAVILNPKIPITGLADSKKLSAKDLQALRAIARKIDASPEKKK